MLVAVTILAFAVVLLALLSTAWRLYAISRGRAYPR
jgi:hypothetical protein